MRPTTPPASSDTCTICGSASTVSRDIKHIVVYRRRVPSRETVEADPQTVHVSLDAGGVVGRMLVDNAISPNEHEALLGCRRPASSKLL